MWHNKHGESRTRLYGLVSLTAWLLLACSQAQLLVQAQSPVPSVTEQDLKDLVQLTVVSSPYTLSFSIADEDKDRYTIENITCRTGSVPLVVANKDLVCEGLHPCSAYTNSITLKAIDVEGGTSIDQTLVAYTDYSEPRSTLISVNATATSISVTWETTNRACVKVFEIFAVASDYSKSTQRLNDESTYTFLDMLPCRTYNVSLDTKNNETISVHNETQLVDTHYLEPGDLTLTISNRSNGDTRISWADPDNKSCIGNYTFVWRRLDCEPDPPEEDSTTTTMETTQTTGETDAPEIEPYGQRPKTRTVCEWNEFSNDTTLKELTLGDLQGCDQYAIEVYINMERDSKAKAIETFSSAEKLPSSVADPYQIVNATELEWLWYPPADNPKCVGNYRVNLTGPVRQSEFESDEQLTNDSRVLFTKLHPCGQYNVEIVPISLNGSAGAKFQGQSTLSEDQPSQILDPTSVSKNFSIELSWKTPEYADLCIEGYRITGWMDDDKVVEALSVSTSNTTVLFDKDLIACQAYTIQIIPYTRENLDGQLRHIEVETTAAVVNSKKINMQLAGSGATSHGLELNANNMDYDNNCQTFFANFSCVAKESVPHIYAEKYVESYREGRGFQTVVEPLSPYTYYTCSVQLYNVAGASDPVLANTRTHVYFPDQPENVTLNSASSSTLSFSWHPPKHLNGLIKYYQTFLMRYEADYFVPDTCDAVVEPSKSDNKGDGTSTMFTDLSPAVKYIIQVAAQNDFGLGQYTAPFLVVTKPDVPGPVTDVNVTLQGPSPDPDVYSANVTIYWTIPCKSNGEIEWFELAFTGRPPGATPFEFKRLVEPDTSNKDGRMSYTETDLKPEISYSVNISVKTRGVATQSKTADKDWQSPSGLPSNLGEDLVKSMRVNPYETNHPTTSAIVRLPVNILSSDSGNIIYVALLLSQKYCAGEPELKYDVMGMDDWPSTLSWEQVGGDCIYQYQTTPERWNPRNERDSTDTDFITFTIGTDKCPDETKRFCNGPLTANTEYNMVVRLFTSSGYNDAALLEFKTDAAIKVTLILVSVCSCLLLAFVAGLVLLWVRKRIAWHRDSGQGIEDPLGNVTAKNFAIYYDEVAKPEKLAREFKEITKVAREISYTASELGSNKNRYADIYPYDKNRVILDIDTEGSDYINASFIDGHPTKKEYIATQGPKVESIIDFWRMVLQHNVRIIVQVTQFREGNTVKCNEYFPYKMRGLSVTIKSKEYFEIYDRTELTVVHDKYGLKKKVVHLYFKKWPDHGCPDDPTHLINFVKKVKAEKRPNYSPIVVHCSAGVGRTGTFIGLDLIMQRLKSESKINIFETVKKLRFQRMKMVQTQQQYAFLYACTYELVKHKISRAALKLEGRTKPTSPDTPPAASAIKKVSFPATDAAVYDTPDPELGNGDCGNTTLSLRFNGLRKPNDLGSLYEQPERNSRQGGENEECAI